MHSQVDPGAVAADFRVSVGDEGGVALVPSLVLYLHVTDLQRDAVDELQAASVLRVVHLQHDQHARIVSLEDTEFLPSLPALARNYV